MAVDGLTYQGGVVKFAEGTATASGAKLKELLKDEKDLNVNNCTALVATKEYTEAEANKIVELCKKLEANTNETRDSMVTMFNNWAMGTNSTETAKQYAKGSTDAELNKSILDFAQSYVDKYGNLDGNINLAEFATLTGLTETQAQNLFNMLDVDKTGESKSAITANEFAAFLKVIDGMGDVQTFKADGKIDLLDFQIFFSTDYANSTTIDPETNMTGYQAMQTELKEAIKDFNALKTNTTTNAAGTNTTTAATDTDTTAAATGTDTTEATGNNTAATAVGGANATYSTATTTGDKQATITQLKAKYSADFKGGDPYKMDNPQMKKFQEFINAGEIEKLGLSFSRNDIVDIVNEVFPNIGISRKDGGDKFSVPYGHDTQARELYQNFMTKLTEATGSTAQIRALETQLTEKTNQINTNLSNIQSLSTAIQSAKAEITRMVDDAIQEAENIEQEYKQKAKDTVSDEIDAYADSDGSMSYAEFQTHLTGKLNAIDPSGRLSAVTTKLTQAENKYTQIRNMVSQIGQLNNTNTTLRADIETITGQIAEKKAAAAEAPQALDSVQRTDPIGFKLQDNVRIDFFLDKDSDGKVSNENEFLGAENGWAEMTALDTNNDKSVSFEELSGKEGLKAVKTTTDANGNVVSQEILDIKDIMQTGDSIDLNSYENNGKMFETGNILQGTFDVTAKGQKLEGYQTLDTLDWLDEQYEFSDKDNGIGRFAQGEISQLSNTAEAKAADFNSILTEMEQKLTAGWAALGIERDTIKDKIQAANDAAAKARAQSIAKAFGTTVKDVPMAEATKETTPTDGDTTTTAEKEKYDKNSGKWKSLLENIESQQGKGAIENQYKIALNYLRRECDYSDADETEAMTDIGGAVRKALANSNAANVEGNERDILRSYNKYVKEDVLKDNKYKDREINFKDIKMIDNEAE